jgi:hypothetical protein
VTRLGEFSPTGQLFALGRLFLMTEAAKIFGQLYSTGKKLCIIFDKNDLG